MLRDILNRYAWILGLILLIWIVQLVNMISGYSLNQLLGLEPRELDGLPGIVAMPFLHASPAHALANTGPVFIMGGIMTIVARQALPLATAIVVGLGGVLVWVFARDAVHVGASGLIFGWFGFLAVRGLIDRSLISIIASIGVVGIYGAMVWGVLPGRADVSWEAHLFGAIAGVVAAILTPVVAARQEKRRARRSLR